MSPLGENPLTIQARNSGTSVKRTTSEAVLKTKRDFFKDTVAVVNTDVSNAVSCIASYKPPRSRLTLY